MACHLYTRDRSYVIHNAANLSESSRAPRYGGTVLEPQHHAAARLPAGPVPGAEELHWGQI